MRRGVLVLAIVMMASVLPARAADLVLTIELREKTVAEYHPPYLAAWVERPDGTVAAHVAIWYGVRMPGGEGQTWLKDLRQWWRRGGRDARLPIDGVTGATRSAGRHVVRLSGDSGPLAGLAPGRYDLVIEVAREVGGRDLVRLPLVWPAPASATSVSGTNELGRVTLEVTP